jgi:hypothetical protein
MRVWHRDSGTGWRQHLLMSWRVHLYWALEDLTMDGTKVVIGGGGDRQIVVLRQHLVTTSHKEFHVSDCIRDVF